MREIAPRDRKRWAVLDIEINSVDAFQGREVDVLVYSVTRSNGQGRLGFVRPSPPLERGLEPRERCPRDLRRRRTLPTFVRVGQCFPPASWITLPPSGMSVLWRLLR